MGKIRVAIAGVGNCCSALVQGVYYYRGAPDDADIPGLLHPNFGGYRIEDIEFVAAFDVDASKVGKDLSEAIFSGLNNTRRFADVPRLGVRVMNAPVMDGLGKYLKDVIKVSNEPVADVAQVLKDVKADVLVNYLPVGSEQAVRWYASQALEAGCGFVNCMPVFVASDPAWAQKFADRGLPVAGDDIQSQLGATVLHKTLVRLLEERGVRIEETYQLNVGGDTDFLNMLERERLASKEVSKTMAVQQMASHEFPVKIGPSDYIPFLENRKICYVWIKGRYFGDTPLTLDVKLSVWDAPNSAGMVIDVIRAVKLAMDRGIGGPLISISAWAFKHPPVHAPASVAKMWVEEFIKGVRER
ncbi:MAG: inositol-3-phosphate synthase [Thermoprotei archaeon]|nr:MAG: inositol-3-phosphate synthase [Thermoprotei archaeon]RLF14194.1 MAG: inositol-3-phosphate synthase [Thermoprotei archaeon]